MKITVFFKVKYLNNEQGWRRTKKDGEERKRGREKESTPGYNQTIFLIVFCFTSVELKNIFLHNRISYSGVKP